MITSGHYLNVDENGFDVYVIFPEWWDEPTKEELDTITDQIEAVLNCDVNDWTTEATLLEKLEKEFEGEEFLVFCR